MGGLVHALGPCGSLQQPLLWGCESLLLPPQPPQAFSIRGLRLYFPVPEPWVAWSASLPTVCPGLSVCECRLWGATRCPACPVLHQSESSPLGLSLCECGAAGSARGQTSCPFRPTLCQSWSRQSHGSPLCPGPCLRPSYRSGCMFLFYLRGVRLPCHSIFCQFWVRGGIVCLPTPPSWFSSNILFRPPSFAISSHWSSFRMDKVDSPALLTNESWVHSFPVLGGFLWLGSNAHTLLKI